MNRRPGAGGLVPQAGRLVEAVVAGPPHGEGEVSGRDPGAGSDRRGQRSFMGHVAVDLGSDLIRAAVLTGADVGDSVAADGLVRGDEAALFMDPAYRPCRSTRGAGRGRHGRLAACLTATRRHWRLR